MRCLLHAFLSLSLSLVLVCFTASISAATPEYAQKTGQGCGVCHTGAEGGGLNATGLEYAASGYVWPPEGGYRILGPIRKPFRLLIGFLHITASFIWFGTILYVHILLKPAYAERGLPRGEVLTGIASMLTVGITGILLTVSRINGIEVMFETRWGILLSVKIALYLVMVFTAAIAVTVISPRLRRGMKKKAELPKSGVFCSSELAAFDGREGRPAYIAYQGMVYDVTGLKLWQGGVHMKHPAGRDLTSALSKAPHGEEKLQSLDTKGTFDREAMPPKSLAQRGFYLIAYLNLAIVFLVLIVISLWRWGI